MSQPHQPKESDLIKATKMEDPEGDRLFAEVQPGVAIVKVEQPQVAAAETAIVPTVKKRSFAADIRLTDPVGMTNNELAEVVIQGFRKIRPYIPYIITLRQRFLNGDRDDKNRLIEPIKGCSSWKEFCVELLHRTPQAVGKAIRESKPKDTDGATPSKPTPVIDTAAVNKPNSQIVEEGLERQHQAELKWAKDQSFEEGRLAERKVQAILASKKKPTAPKPEPTPSQSTCAIVAVEPQPTATTYADASTALAFANELTLFILRTVGDDGLVSIASCKQIRFFAEKYQAAIALTNPESAIPTTPERDPSCLTCPRCGNQKGIQSVQRNVGQPVRRYRCTKCDLKTGCNRFTPQTSAPMEAVEVQA